MVGRGLRCSPGKRDCIVLDQSGNTMVHGPITGPSGYAPEPWGDDNDDVTASKAGKPKLVCYDSFISLLVLCFARFNNDCDVCLR